MSTTDLDRLHKVFNDPDPKRGAGRTFLDCHTVAGVLESTEGAGVVCVVPSYDRVSHIMRLMTLRVFPEHGINFCRIISQTQFVFILPGEIKKYIRFAVPHDDTVESLAMIGNTWPIVNFTEYDREGETVPYEKRRKYYIEPYIG